MRYRQILFFAHGEDEAVAQIVGYQAGNTTVERNFTFLKTSRSENRR